MYGGLMAGNGGIDGTRKIGLEGGNGGLVLGN